MQKLLVTIISLVFSTNSALACEHTENGAVVLTISESRVCEDTDVIRCVSPSKRLIHGPCPVTYKRAYVDHSGTNLFCCVAEKCKTELTVTDDIMRYNNIMDYSR